MIGQHVKAISKSMDLNSSTYENFILLSDFNADMVLQIFAISILLLAWSIQQPGLLQKFFKAVLYWFDSYKSPKTFW